MTHNFQFSFLTKVPPNFINFRYHESTPALEIIINILLSALLLDVKEKLILREKFSIKSHSGTRETAGKICVTK